MPMITVGGREYELPRPTIPYLVELAEIIDSEHPGLAGGIARNGELVEAAMKRAGNADFDRTVAEISADELNAAAAAVMRAAGFMPSGEASPADAGSRTASMTSSPLSPPAADTSGREILPS